MNWSPPITSRHILHRRVLWPIPVQNIINARFTSALIGRDFLLMLRNRVLRTKIASCACGTTSCGSIVPPVGPGPRPAAFFCFLRVKIGALRLRGDLLRLTNPSCGSSAASCGLSSRPCGSGRLPAVKNRVLALREALLAACEPFLRVKTSSCAVTSRPAGQNTVQRCKKPSCGIILRPVGPSSHPVA